MAPKKPNGANRPKADAHRKAIGDGVRGSKRTVEQRQAASDLRKKPRGPRTEEAKQAAAAAMRANLWKRGITRPLNKQFRDKIFPLVYAEIKNHYLVLGSFKTFRIVELTRDAFSPEPGRRDRLVICLSEGRVRKFVIG